MISFHTTIKSLCSKVCCCALNCAHFSEESRFYIFEGIVRDHLVYFGFVTSDYCQFVDVNLISNPDSENYHSGFSHSFCCGFCLGRHCWLAVRYHNDNVGHSITSAMFSSEPLSLYETKSSVSVGVAMVTFNSLDSVEHCTPILVLVEEEAVVDVRAESHHSNLSVLWTNYCVFDEIAEKVHLLLIVVVPDARRLVQHEDNIGWFNTTDW